VLSIFFTISTEFEVVELITLLAGDQLVLFLYGITPFFRNFSMKSHFIRNYASVFTDSSVKVRILNFTLRTSPFVVV
jgi:hypothetical protein